MGERGRVRRLWTRLFGPVLLCDLVRLPRRRIATIFLARILYIGLLFLALIVYYALEMRIRTPERLWEALLAGAPVGQADAPVFAFRFFSALMIAQLFAVLLLTPTYTAGAIAEDRERRILDFLLASDLTNREIVLGKLFARLANLALLLLAGLPIMGLVQLFGGVDPNLVLAGFAASALMMLSIGSLGVLQSIYAQRPRQAVFRTYLIAGVYLLGTTMCLLPSPGPPGGMGVPVLDRLFDILGSGNPLLAANRMRVGLEGGRSLNHILPEVLTDYAIFHIFVLVGCTSWSIRHLRRILTTTPETPMEELARTLHARRLRLVEDAMSLPSLSELEPSAPPRPPVSNRPLLWKELHVEPAPYYLPGVWGFLLSSSSLLLLLYCGGSFVLLLTLGLALGDTNQLSNFWVRGVAVPLVCLLMVGIAVRAAGGLTRERERGTFGSLLTSGLENREIVDDKWFGSILSVRMGWYVLTAVWILAKCTGGLSLVALVLLVFVTVSYAALAASLGVCCSLCCRNTWRATVLTLTLLAAITIGPRLSGFYVPTPPEAIFRLAEPGWVRSEKSEWTPTTGKDLILFASGFHALIAAGLWIFARTRFSTVTGRMPVGRRN